MEPTVNGAAINPDDFLAQALADVAGESDLDLASDAELGLPDAYQEEMIAGVGVEHADRLIKVKWDILNARLNHQEDEVKKLTAGELASRAILTRIKREHPRAHAIIQWALAKRAENNERARQQTAG